MQAGRVGNLLMWDLDEALPIIRELQGEIRPLGYHLTLGGGVLNKGHSYKDLDIYIIPLVGETAKIIDLMNLLAHKFGEPEEIGSGGASYEPDVYAYKQQYGTKDRRIDIFVIKGG